MSAAPGQLTAAWFMTGVAEATLYTTPDGGSVNMFDDTSCAGADCIGKTELKTLNAAYYGVSALAGSAAACNDPTKLDNCTRDQKAGIFVNSYTIDLVANTWSMDYTTVPPSGLWKGVPFHIIFRGTVVRPSCPVVGYVWSDPANRSMIVFGSNLRGTTGVMIDGVNAPVFQAVGDDMLWVFPPNAVTWPWKPGTVQVTNANAGCSGHYPNSCTP